MESLISTAEMHLQRVLWDLEQVQEWMKMFTWMQEAGKNLNN